MNAVITLRFSTYTLQIYRNEESGKKHAASLPRATQKTHIHTEQISEADRLRAEYAEVPREDVRRMTFKQF